MIDPEVLSQTGDHNLLEVFPKEEYGKTRKELRQLKKEAVLAKKPSVGDEIASDRKKLGQKVEGAALSKKYTTALKTIEGLERELSFVKRLEGTVETYKIEPKKVSGTSEAVCVWMASDWHVEEEVDPATISGLNKYTLPIAKDRAQQFFKNALRLTTILARDVEIKTIVLALLGDFFSNDIHEEIAEMAQESPVHAIIEAQNMIASGIEFVLKNSLVEIVVPCHSGNHARSTDTTRFSTENGHSFEFYMYTYLKMYFRNEPRVKFLISEGYHSYMDIYGTSVRFHHGHAIKYGGGVGGITIPVNKAIAQWNRGRKADLDVFGHFHQRFDGGNFLCNGSLIGYNAFALSIKASFEKPSQTLFLIDKKRGKTCVWPVMFD